MLSITVNGTPQSVPDDMNVAEVVSRWCPSPDGIAVARNGEVVPRSTWVSTALTSDDKLEIVTAAAGG